MTMERLFLGRDREYANEVFQKLREPCTDGKVNFLDQFVEAVTQGLQKSGNEPTKETCKKVKELYTSCVQEIVTKKCDLKLDKKNQKAIDQAADFLANGIFKETYFNVNNLDYTITEDIMLRDAQKEYVGEEEKSAFGTFVTNQFYQNGVYANLSMKQANKLFPMALWRMQEVFVQTARNVVAKKILPENLLNESGFKIYEPKDYNKRLKQLPSKKDSAAVSYTFQ